MLLTSSLHVSATDSLANKKIVKVEVCKEHLENLSEASTLLVSCVDFRLTEETDKFMHQLGLKDDYDKVSLPGASLALVNEQYAYWGKTIEDTIEILTKLHNIKQIIFLDHRECGAYKLLMGEKYLKTPEATTEAHSMILQKARNVIREKFPNLRIYTFLMGLDGVVEQIYENS